MKLALKHLQKRHTSADCVKKCGVTQISAADGKTTTSCLPHWSQSLLRFSNQSRCSRARVMSAESTLDAFHPAGKTSEYPDGVPRSLQPYPRTIAHQLGRLCSAGKCPGHRVASASRQHKRVGENPFHHR